MNNLIKTPRTEGAEIWKEFDKLPLYAQFWVECAIDIIVENHFVKNREQELKKLFGKDCVKELPMGSGGVGQLKILKSEARLQIGHGHGKHNYAKTLVIEI